jgi:hypothetical protein
MNEANAIQPRFGSYFGNIAFLAHAHFGSLKLIRNLFGILAFADAIGSYFLGPVVLTITLGLFAIPAFLQSNLAKENAIKHLREVTLNLVRWHMEDAAACTRFCTVECPPFETLHKLLITLQPFDAFRKGA